MCNLFCNVTCLFAKTTLGQFTSNSIFNCQVQFFSNDENEQKLSQTSLPIVGSTEWGIAPQLLKYVTKNMAPDEG